MNARENIDVFMRAFSAAGPVAPQIDQATGRLSTGSKTSRRLVLASSSSRRRELVGAFSQLFEVFAPDDTEDQRLDVESPGDFVARLALTKALEVGRRCGPAVVVGADTAVFLDGEIYGKPATPAEAAQMLGRLRGRTHLVMTGLAVLDTESGRWLVSSTSTDVTMRRYSDAEVADYVASGEPFDKAGGYAIQDETFDPVAQIRGCYSNVVGLPLCETLGLLSRLGSDAVLRPNWRPPDRCDDCVLATRTEGDLQ